MCCFCVVAYPASAQRCFAFFNTNRAKQVNRLLLYVQKTRPSPGFHCGNGIIICISCVLCLIFHGQASNKFLVVESRNIIKRFKGSPRVRFLSLAILFSFFQKGLAPKTGIIQTNIKKKKRCSFVRSSVRSLARVSLLL